MSHRRLLVELRAGGSAIQSMWLRTRRVAGACEAVGAATLSVIAEQLTVQGGGTLSRGMAVKSPDHASAWYIAAEIDGPGMEGGGDVGVWLANSTSATSGFLSVGGLANEFSDWIDGSTTDARTSITDAGAEAAQACL